MDPNSLEQLASTLSANVIITADKQSRQKPITFTNIIACCGILLKECIQPALTLESAISEQKSITVHTWKKIQKALPKSWDPLFTTLNNSFQDFWKLGKFITLDELMWPWESYHDPSVIYIEGKPHPWGIKVFALVTFGTFTHSPYCFYFVPDLCKDIGQSDIMNISHSIVQNRVPITGDRWFGSLKWLEEHPGFQRTFSLKKSEGEGLFHLFGNGLSAGEYRIFQNGDLFLSVWASNHLVKTVSTQYSLQSNDVEVNQAPEVNDQMSYRSAIALKGVPKNDLQILAKRLNVPFCKYSLLIILTSK